MAFTKAVRERVPLLISLSGTSGSGKTLSGLILAGGLVDPKKGRVGFLDAENKRGKMYSDGELVKKALPNGYEYEELTGPFSPARYAEKIVQAQEEGITLLLIDSFSHEHEGFGGVCDIAENNKLRGMPNWAMAKIAHKRLMNKLLCSPMDIILCLRAREKVKIMKDANGKEQVVPVGIQPVTEKNVVYEMILSLQLDEQTHFAHPLKVPQPLAHIFPIEGKLITTECGERIREWNDTGVASDPRELLKKRARLAAEDGMEAYKSFFQALSADQKKSVDHENNKLLAKMADDDRASAVDDGTLAQGAA